MDAESEKRKVLQRKKSLNPCIWYVVVPLNAFQHLLGLGLGLTLNGSIYSLISLLA